MWLFLCFSSAWKWQETIPVLHIIIVINKHCIAQVTLWSHKNALGTIHPLLYIYKYERQPEKAEKPDRLLAPNGFRGILHLHSSLPRTFSPWSSLSHCSIGTFVHFWLHSLAPCTGSVVLTSTSSLAAAECSVVLLYLSKLHSTIQARALLAREGKLKQGGVLRRWYLDNIR